MGHYKEFFEFGTLIFLKYFITKHQKMLENLQSSGPNTKYSRMKHNSSSVRKKSVRPQMVTYPQRF